MNASNRRGRANRKRRGASREHPVGASPRGGHRRRGETRLRMARSLSPGTMPGERSRELDLREFRRAAQGEIASGLTALGKCLTTSSSLSPGASSTTGVGCPGRSRFMYARGGASGDRRRPCVRCPRGAGSRQDGSFWAESGVPVRRRSRGGRSLPASSPNEPDRQDLRCFAGRQCRTAGEPYVGRVCAGGSV